MQKPQNLKELILEAIVEARIMECARDVYDENNVLLTAMRLSGAPYSFIQEVANIH
jgi:hypothetical protein